MAAPNKTIVNLEMINTLTEGCPGCGKPFSFGEPVVLACGAWQGGPKYIHENEAVFDPRTSTYVERKCFEAGIDPGL
jgi:hypothetical protein